MGKAYRWEEDGEMGEWMVDSGVVDWLVTWIKATIFPGAENRIQLSTVTVPSRYWASSLPPKNNRGKADT